jgi:apolipoprotein N-acyltransferase
LSSLLFDAATSPELVYSWPAWLLIVLGLGLRRISGDARTPRGDAVIVELCLGIVAVTALLFWLVVSLRVLF